MSWICSNCSTTNDDTSNSCFVCDSKKSLKPSQAKQAGKQRTKAKGAGKQGTKAKGAGEQQSGTRIVSSSRNFIFDKDLPTSVKYLGVSDMDSLPIVIIKEKGEVSEETLADIEKKYAAAVLSHVKCIRGCTGIQVTYSDKLAPVWRCKRAMEYGLDYAEALADECQREGKCVYRRKIR